jgi:hypothetical protein
MTYPRQTSAGDGMPIEGRGGRHVKFQLGDTVQVGTRVGTITDIGTVVIQFKTNDGCLRVACPWEVERISSLPQRLSLQTLSQQQLGMVMVVKRPVDEAIWPGRSLEPPSHTRAVERAWHGYWPQTHRLDAAWQSPEGVVSARSPRGSAPDRPPS